MKNKQKHLVLTSFLKKKLFSKKKFRGISILEILVVMVIASILATTGIVGARNYSKRTKDKVREVNVQQIMNIIKNDAYTTNSNKQFVYTAEEFKQVLANADLELPKTDDICYFYVGGTGLDASDPTDNTFAIMTWGETSSTIDPKSPGVLINGDSTTVNHFNYAHLTKEDFVCNDGILTITSNLSQYLFAASNKVKLCHENEKVLNLPQPAVQAHLDHGDYLGECVEQNQPEWSDWSACSVNCGGGTQTRTLSCPLFGSPGCTEQTESRSCNTQACDTCSNDRYVYNCGGNHDNLIDWANTTPLGAEQIRLVISSGQIIRLHNQ